MRDDDSDNVGLKAYSIYKFNLIDYIKSILQLFCYIFTTIILVGAMLWWYQDKQPICGNILDLIYILILYCLLFTSIVACKDIPNYNDYPTIYIENDIPDEILRNRVLIRNMEQWSKLGEINVEL